MNRDVLEAELLIKFAEKRRSQVVVTEEDILEDIKLARAYADLWESSKPKPAPQGF